MDKKVTGIVAYITWIGWFIAFFAGDKEGAKLHLNQALVLNLISVVLNILRYIPIIGIVASIVSIAVFVLCILGIVSAVKEDDKPLPVVGGIQLLK